MGVLISGIGRSSNLTLWMPSRTKERFCGEEGRLSAWRCLDGRGAEVVSATFTVSVVDPMLAQVCWLRNV